MSDADALPALGPDSVAARQRPQRRWLSAQVLLPGLGVSAGLLLIFGPFLAAVIRSVIDMPASGVELSLRNFQVLLADPRFFAAVGNTLICAGGATALSCLFGVSLAWVVTRTDMPGRRWFELLNLIPFFLSPYVGALSWIYLAAPRSGLLHWFCRQYLGFTPSWLDIYSLPGVIWVLSLFYTPYIYMFVVAPMAQMDAALEDAARVHGARFWVALRHITLPLLMPAILSGALVVFVTSAGLIDVPMALAAPRGIPTMPTEIFAMVQFPPDFGRAAAYGVLVMAATVLLTMLQRHYIGRRRYDIISSKGYRPRVIRLRTAGRTAALALEAVYLGGAVVLPLMALVLVSFSSIWTGRFLTRTATLDNYTYVLFGYRLSREAILNSLLLAVVGATITVAMGVLQAYYVGRGVAGQRRRGWVDACLSLPLGIPGIILALGFLIMAVRTPLYSTLSIILIAYIARFYPFATRTIGAMLLAINTELEQSARACGASWLQTMRLIMLPLLKPAIISAWLMLFVIFVRELGATILLYAQGTETLSIALLILADQNSGYVAALAMVQLAMLMAAFALFQLARGAPPQNG